MSDAREDATVVAATSPNAPGWYPYGAVGQLAHFDGTAWTGERSAEPSVGAPPPWVRHRRAGTSWLGLMVVGQLLCLAAGLAAGRCSQAWSWSSVIGYTIFMAGCVRLASKYLHLEELDGLRRLYVLGVVSGIVGLAVTLPLETWSLHGLGTGATLWLAGPIEETSKLLVPVLVLLFARGRLGDPRRGLAVVIVSGATFGALEGAKWQIDTSYRWNHLLLSLVRPGVEIFHPVLSGVAGAVIWLSAWRAGKAVTSMGVKSYVLTVVVHGVHDGLGTLFIPRGHKVTLTLPPYTFARALGVGLGSGVIGLLVSLAFFVLFRHSARELVPPSHLSTTPPRWRPRVKPWATRPDYYDANHRAREGPP